ncbi:nucleotide-binding universal stress UspA family protein [Alkalibacillus filiformis]|uniref:Universal stress protein n=2 Tax=Alkalibacillus TaxID=331654 RepID=A0A511W6I4_9BACI|nr:MULTISPECIES: universal stress protein [Alkalibacillus]MDQ0351258.1 nucleotide-binding universal stress UspA family protein [Alkalibacillus filiformis]MDV2581222.1 universal stress protein [Alkalibacillus haloalkaliphilus]GEN45908.1 universal stress protein [Alkalibacillus haloalkaliphilus]
MAFEYHDIVIAVDGSKASEYAFLKAIDIAKRNHAKLIISHVVDTRVYSTIEAYDRSVSDRVQNDALELLRTYQTRAEEAGVENVVTDLEHGSPKVKIAKEVAPRHNADLIICGATGMNTVERFFIGSVSEHITRYSKVDVLVIRPEDSK